MYSRLGPAACMASLRIAVARSRRGHAALGGLGWGLVAGRGPLVGGRLAHGRESWQAPAVQVAGVMEADPWGQGQLRGLLPGLHGGLPAACCSGGCAACRPWLCSCCGSYGGHRSWL